MAFITIIHLRFYICFLVCVITLLPLSSCSSLPSQYEDYTYTVSVQYRECRDYSYTYCYNWWYWNYWHWGWSWHSHWYYGWYWNPWWGWGRWNWCNTHTRTECYYTYRNEPRTGRRCKSGWIGSQCNTPTCTPSCPREQACVDLNKCECIGGSSGCDIVPCSTANNCYPGTCVYGACKCPPGFDGPNCLSFSVQPSITGCKVTLYAGSPETEVAVADCAAEGLTPSITWINGPRLMKGVSGLGLTRILPEWTATYEHPVSMPVRPSGTSQFFVSNAPVAIGIAETSFKIIFPNDNFVKEPSPKCVQWDVSSAISTSRRCQNTYRWSDLNVNTLLQHNAT